jgi:hypothetical protein
MHGKLSLRLLIAVLLGVLILSLIYLYQKEQEKRKYEEMMIKLSNAGEEATRLAKLFLPEFDAHYYFDASTYVKIVNNTVYYQWIKYFKEQNGTCPPCGVYAFRIVLPRYRCITIEGVSYCPNQNKKFSEILKDVVPEKLYNWVPELFWIARPITIDKTNGTVLYFDIKWKPTENELINLAEKDLMDIFKIKDLLQEVNLTISFSLAQNKHCIEVPLSLTENQTLIVQVPNYIETYNSSCKIVSVEKIANNELKLKISCSYLKDLPYTAIICYE